MAKKRFNERTTTRPTDSVPGICGLPADRMEVEDTETGNKSEGVGFNVKEARENAYDKMERGEYVEDDD